MDDQGARLWRRTCALIEGVLLLLEQRRCACLGAVGALLHHFIHGLFPLRFQRLELQGAHEDVPAPWPQQEAEHANTQDKLCALWVLLVQVRNSGHRAVEAVLPGEADEDADGGDDREDGALRRLRVGAGPAEGVVDLVETVHHEERGERQRDGQHDAAVDRVHLDAEERVQHPSPAGTHQDAPREGHGARVHDDIDNTLGHAFFLLVLTRDTRADLRGQDGGRAEEHAHAPERQDVCAAEREEHRLLEALLVGELAGDGEAADLHREEGGGQAQDVVFGLADGLVHQRRPLALPPRQLRLRPQALPEDRRALEHRDEHQRRHEHWYEAQGRVLPEERRLLHGAAGRDGCEACHVRQQRRPARVPPRAVLQLDLLLDDGHLQAVVVRVHALARFLVVAGDRAHAVLWHRGLEADQHGVRDGPLLLFEVDPGVPGLVNTGVPPDEEDQDEEVDRAMHEVHDDHEALTQTELRRPAVEHLFVALEEQDGHEDGDRVADDPPGVAAHVVVVHVDELEEAHDKGHASEKHGRCVDVDRSELLLLLLLLVLLDCGHVDAPVVPVVIQLAALVVVVVVLVVADLANPVALLIVLVVLVEDDSDTCGIVETLLGPHGVILLLVLDVGTKVGDLLGEPEKLREVLVRDRAKDLLDVLLPLRVQHAVRLDGGQHLVGGAAQHVGRLVAEGLLQPVQKLLVDGFRRLRARPVDLHLGDICAQHGLALVDVHLSLLLHHRLAPAPLLLHLPLLLLLQLLQLLGLLILNEVAHFVVDAAAERLGLAGGLVLRGRGALALQHQVGVRAVLEPLELGELLGHLCCCSEEGAATMRAATGRGRGGMRRSNGARGSSSEP
mmetsp:Transcript_146029/g.364108  ORF Transcript_146029/g.364108 Transcript_146029/m.364108 type:complete len:844 (-) Transcript_146029:2-2533(-)